MRSILSAELNDEALARFFTYARERYKIFQIRKKTRQKWPWSTDPILNTYRFCNVFREDDVVTQWVKQNVRDPLRSSPSAIYGMLVCRLINRVSTLEKLMEHGRVKYGDELHHFTTCDPEAIISLGRETSPFITGAYMIKTPSGIDKPSGVAYIFSNAHQSCLKLGEHCLNQPITMQWLHANLVNLPYIGGFLAYELVTDLTHTDVLRDCADLNTWCHMGPGAQRGIRRLCGEEDVSHVVNVPTNPSMLAKLMDVLRCSKDYDYWPPWWPQWTMREVEHTLCEFDKYERARLEQGQPKQLYKRD